MDDPSSFHTAWWFVAVERIAESNGNRQPYT